MIEFEAKLHVAGTNKRDNWQHSKHMSQEDNKIKDPKTKPYKLRKSQARQKV